MKTRINSLGTAWRIRPFCLIATWVAVLFNSIPAHTKTIAARSPSFTDVYEAVNTASIGDIVTVPPGGATWNRVLWITKGITLIGAGQASTIITNRIPRTDPIPVNGPSPWTTTSTDNLPPLVAIRLAQSAPVRISGFYFDCNGTSGGQGIYVDHLSGSTVDLTALRIDHITFTNAFKRGVYIRGAYGVVDHCYFVNCLKSVDSYRSYNSEWKKFTPPLYGMGTTNTTVIEDCTFTMTDTYTSGIALCSSDWGSHYVFRYNSVINPNDLIESDGLDVHGNAYYLDNLLNPLWRGSMFFECYGNTFHLGKTYPRSMNVRGGTSMIFSNTFICSDTRTNPASSPCKIRFQEEESWASTRYIPLRTTYPAEDQITNTFVFGNKLNGVPWQNPVYISRVEEQNLIKPGRDYFLSDPWSGAYTNGSGAVGAMTRYRPLVYPHPRISADLGGLPPSAPIGLRTNAEPTTLASP